MIISVRGTHGSGKSTVVRRVMKFYPHCTPVMREGRRRPFGYLLEHDGLRRLAVLGHYETPCGGCDSLPAVEDMYSFVREQASSGADVLLEGILAQHYALKKFLTFSEFDIKVIVLSTPLEQCIHDTLSRRGDTTPEREAKITGTITSEYRNVENGVKRLLANKVDVRRLNRTDALSTCLELLGVPMVVNEGI